MKRDSKNKNENEIEIEIEISDNQLVEFLKKNLQNEEENKG